jgi:hypothetical protein
MSGLKSRLDKLEAHFGAGDHAPKQLAVVAVGRQSEAEIAEFVRAGGYSDDGLFIIKLVGLGNDGLLDDRPLAWAGGSGPRV